MIKVTDYRQNRLKEIFKSMGFQWNDRGQPVRSAKLADLGITKNRMKDLLENREDKVALQVYEAAAIASWLGIQPSNLYKDDQTPIEELHIKIEVEA